jgi:undecaprenyl pyrophosphate synthase
MYEAEKQKIEMYKSKVEAYTAVIKSITEKYATQVEGFKAYLGAWSASSDSQTKLIDIGTRAQIAKVEATIKEWEVQLRLIQENTALKLEALKAVAQTASNLAAGSLSAGHASASASFSGIDQLNSSG